MYRDNSSASLDFEAEVYEVASPRRENGAVWRVAVLLVVFWISVCCLSHFLRTRHKFAVHPDPFDRAVTGAIALIPVLFVPLLPLHFVVRLFFARKRRRTVTVQFAGREVRWGGRGRARSRIEELQSFVSVRIGSRRHVVFATEGMDAPLSMRVPDERAALRISRILGADKFGLGTMSFPVEIGEKVKPSHTLKRASLALFVAGFAVVEGVAVLMGPWASFGVLLFVAPLSLPVVVYLAVVSWSALADPSTKRLKIDAAHVSIDGSILCLHTDSVKLRLGKNEGLEITSSRIPGGKCIVYSWPPGELEELELIKATIQAHRARASTDAPG